jgi:hypothetical protein
MADRSQLLERLRKLLALAKSPNQHEAAAARKAADGIMLKHGFTEDDAREAEREGYFELPLGAKGWNATWRFTLVTAAARFCGAEAIALQIGPRRKVRLVGERASVEAAHALYLKLLKVVAELETLVGEIYPEEISWFCETSSAREISDSFRRGVVYGILILMSKLDQETRSSPPTTTDPNTNSTVNASQPPKANQPGLVKTKPDKTHTEKIKQRYQPKEKPLRLDDVENLFMFDFARRLTSRHVAFSSDGLTVMAVEIVK